MKSKVVSDKSRILHLQRQLAKEKIDACLIENPLDLFYLTGLKLSRGSLLIHNKKATLFVDSRYIQYAQDNSPVNVALEHSAILKDLKIKKLLFDSVYTSHDRFLRLKKQCGKAELVCSVPFFKTLRLIKDENEIKKMMKSASLLWKGFEWISHALKKGVTERDLAKGFEVFCLQHGADRLAFEPIIAFGANSAMPHYRSQNARLKEGNTVLVDIGVVLDGYHSDMTRVLFYKKEDPLMRHFYELAKRAQKEALSLCRPKTKIQDLDIAARNVFKKEGVEELFVHSLGHGIGLETHEYPRIKFDGEDKDCVLQAGMVVTIEPGLYLPGKGGVRYEDTVLITKDGYINFYES